MSSPNDSFDAESQSRQPDGDDDNSKYFWPGIIGVLIVFAVLVFAGTLNDRSAPVINATSTPSLQQLSPSYAIRDVTGTIGSAPARE